MKFLPHQIWILALRRPGQRHHMMLLPSKEESLKRLRHHTGQDFGDDIGKWRTWYRMFPTGRPTMSSAPHPSAPKIKRFPAAKQRRLDELLLRNSEGKLLPAERKRLESLVDEAERLMVANAKVLADFAACEKAAKPSTALPLTVWVTLESAQR